MDILLDKLIGGEISIHGSRNPKRYLYSDGRLFLVTDYSKDSEGELVCDTEDIEEAIHALNGSL